MIAYRFGDSSVKRGYSPKGRRAFEICHPIRAGDLASFLALRPLSSEKRIKKKWRWRLVVCDVITFRHGVTTQCATSALSSHSLERPEI